MGFFVVVQDGVITAVGDTRTEIENVRTGQAILEIDLPEGFSLREPPTTVLIAYVECDTPAAIGAVRSACAQAIEKEPDPDMLERYRDLTGLMASNGESNGDEK